MPKKMTNDEIVDYFINCKDECEFQTRDIRAKWDTLLDQYLCKKDFSKKKGWQFKVYVPISKPVIKRAVRIIKQILTRSGEYFDFDSPGKNEERKKKCNLTKRALKVYLNAASFIDNLCIALESGFTLAMMILKWYVEEEKSHFTVEETPVTDEEGNEIEGEMEEELVWHKRLKLVCKPVNPFNFYFTMDNEINIEDEWITLPEFKRRMEKNPELYDKNVFNRVMKQDYGPSKSRKDEDKDRLMRLGINDEDGNKYRKEVLISHFWGPLINKDNEVIKENANFIIVNEAHVWLKPRSNPYWHEKSPYIYDSPLGVIFRHIGKGLTEDVSGIEDAIVDFVNLQLDNLMWQLLGIREVDTMAFDERARGELRELYPGKLIQKRTGYTGDAFKFHEMGVPPEKAMAMLQELKLFAEKDHGVSDYVTQFPGEAQTLGEYQGKQQVGMNDFQSIAQDIEKGFIVKNIDMARDLMIQYLADLDSYPNIATIFEDEGMDLVGMSTSEKREMIVTDVDFIGKGISVFYERMNILEKLGAYVKMLNALPEGDRARLYPKYDEILKRINEAFAFDKPDELIRTEDEVAALEQKAMQRQQQQIQMAFKQFQMEMQKEIAIQEKKNEPKLLELLLKAQEQRSTNVLEAVKLALQEGGGNVQ